MWNQHFASLHILAAATVWSGTGNLKTSFPASEICSLRNCVVALLNDVLSYSFSIHVGSRMLIWQRMPFRFSKWGIFWLICWLFISSGLLLVTLSSLPSLLSLPPLLVILLDFLLSGFVFHYLSLGYVSPFLLPSLLFDESLCSGFPTTHSTPPSCCSLHLQALLICTPLLRNTVMDWHAASCFEWDIHVYGNNCCVDGFALTTKL